MDIITFCKTHSKEEIEKVALAAGTNYAHLRYQIVGEHRRMSPRLAKRLVAAAAELGLSELTLAELRPDIWGEQHAA